MLQHNCQYGQRSDLAVVVTYVQNRIAWYLNCTVTLLIHSILGRIIFSCRNMSEIVMIGLFYNARISAL
jgi:hypothetical protein